MFTLGTTRIDSLFTVFLNYHLKPFHVKFKNIEKNKYLRQPSSMSLSELSDRPLVPVVEWLDADELLVVVVVESDEYVQYEETSREKIHG